MLFSESSIWTMLHGIGFGGAGMLALFGVLVAMYLLRHEMPPGGGVRKGRIVARLTGRGSTRRPASTHPREAYPGGPPSR